MADLISNYESHKTIREKLNAVLVPFDGRAAFEATRIPAAVMAVKVIDGGVYELHRDPGGDWISGDGGHWTPLRVPDGDDIAAALAVVPQIEEMHSELSTILDGPGLDASRVAAPAETLLSWLKRNGTFSSRAAFLAALSWPWSVGAVVGDGRVSYRYAGGAAVIPDAPGWVPHGPPSPDHWTWNANPGATDMTAALQAGLTWLGQIGGGILHLLDHAYFVSATLVIDRPNVGIHGRGMYSRSRIIRNGDYGDTIRATGNDITGQMLVGTSFVGFDVYSTGLTTFGAHIHLTAVTHARITDIYMSGGFVAYDFEGATATQVSGIRCVWGPLFGGTAHGRRFFLFRAAAETYPHPSCGDLKISDFNVRSNTTLWGCAVGIEIRSADGIWLTHGYTGSTTVADLLFNASEADHHIGLVFVSNVMTDETQGNAIRFEGTASFGTNVVISNMSLKAGNNGGNGIHVADGAVFRNVQFIGCSVSEFRGHGISLNSAAAENWDLVGCQVRGNSYNAPGSYHGLSIQEGRAIRVTGGQYGRHNVTDVTKTQAYGIAVGANARDITIGGGADLRNNLTGPLLINGTARPYVMIGDVLLDSDNVVASASAIDPPQGRRLVRVTGTVGINNIQVQRSGQMITLYFEDVVTVSAVGNIRPRTAFTSAAGATLTLIYDGTYWREVARAA